MENKPREVTIEPRKDIKVPVIVVNPVEFQIPLCCSEGWKSCPHVVQKQKNVKRNIGM